MANLRLYSIITQITKKPSLVIFFAKNINIWSDLLELFENVAGSVFMKDSVTVNYIHLPFMSFTDPAVTLHLLPPWGNFSDAGFHSPCLLHWFVKHDKICSFCFVCVPFCQTTRSPCFVFCTVLPFKFKLKFYYATKC